LDESIDAAASLVLVGSLMLALGAYVGSSLAAGRPLLEARVEREAALPIVGRAPMHAVYRALVPLARLLADAGVSANAISVASLAIALVAACAFAAGHFGVAALVASVASLADGLDGLVARLRGTKSRTGQVLDTTIDRYVDALLLGGVVVCVRGDLVLLVVTLAAVVGSFMVSYASSVERELSVTAGLAPMRRAHRLAYLIVGSAAAPFVGPALGGLISKPDRVPVMIAVAAIAIVGNVSAVRRLSAAARVADRREDATSPAAEPAEDAAPNNAPERGP
jgi:CDP-diacylglycerol--glycerol-3-phosphate 3-phosphatidyltransferase